MQETQKETTGDLVISDSRIQKSPSNPEEFLVIVDDSVYNLKDFLPQHPGGEALLRPGEARDISAIFHSTHPPGTDSNLAPIRVGKLQADSSLAMNYTYSDPFQNELRRAVHHYLQNEGKVSNFIKHVWQLSFLVLALTAYGYFMLSGGLLRCIVFSVAISLGLVNVMHTVNHGAH